MSVRDIYGNIPKRIIAGKVSVLYALVGLSPGELCAHDLSVDASLPLSLRLLPLLIRLPGCRRCSKVSLSIVPTATALDFYLYRYVYKGKKKYTNMYACACERGVKETRAFRRRSSGNLQQVRPLGRVAALQSRPSSA